MAAQAFAEHFLRLGLPDSVNCKVGRLVGYMALHHGSADRTGLDIDSASRHEILREKQVLIGCGGGYKQNVLIDIVLLRNGWLMLIWPYKMKASNMATLMKHRP